MAKTAFVYLVLVVPGLIWFTDKDWITAASGIIIAAITAMVGIVTVYIGAAAYEDTNK